MISRKNTTEALIISFKHWYTHRCKSGFTWEQGRNGRWYHVVFTPELRQEFLEKFEPKLRKEFGRIGLRAEREQEGTSNFLAVFRKMSKASQRELLNAVMSTDEK